MFLRFGQVMGQAGILQGLAIVLVTIAFTVCISLVMALLKLEDEKCQPKNWRPSILVLSGGAWRRCHIAVYAYWLAAGRED